MQVNLYADIYLHKWTISHSIHCSEVVAGLIPYEEELKFIHCSIYIYIYMIYSSEGLGGVIPCEDRGWGLERIWFLAGYPKLDDPSVLLLQRIVTQLQVDVGVGLGTVNLRLVYVLCPIMYYAVQCPTAWHRGKMKDMKEGYVAIWILVYTIKYFSNTTMIRCSTHVFMQRQLTSIVCSSSNFRDSNFKLQMTPLKPTIIVGKTSSLPFRSSNLWTYG